MSSLLINKEVKITKEIRRKIYLFLFSFKRPLHLQLAKFDHPGSCFRFLMFYTRNGVHVTGQNFSFSLNKMITHFCKPYTNP